MEKLRIREVLEKRGILQKELADMCGISVVAVNRLLNGEKKDRSINVKTLFRIAEALKIPVSELFEKPAGVRCNCPECGSSMRILLKTHKREGK